LLDFIDKWGIEMDPIVKGGKVQFALFKTYLYYVSWFLITIVIVRMKIFYSTIYVPFYTLLIITRHVFFFFFFPFLIKKLRFKMEKNQT
jgi:hypothetical protein